MENGIIIVGDYIYIYIWLPWWFSGKEHACQCRRHGFNPWTGKIPWKRKWQPIPIFLPGKFHGQRSLVDYGPQGHKELDKTEELTRRPNQYI